MSDSGSSSKEKIKKHHKVKKQKKKKSHKSNKKFKRNSKSCDPDSNKYKAKKPHEDYDPFVSNTAETPECIKNNYVENVLFGPALPPHLLTKEKNAMPQSDIPVIGPVIPVELLQKPYVDEEAINEDNEYTFGPVPTGNSFKTMSFAHVELEKRAIEIKLAKFGEDDIKPDEQRVREEWMLELPDVGIKPGLASIKRTFHTGKDRPDFSDR